MDRRQFLGKTAGTLASSTVLLQAACTATNRRAIPRAEILSEPNPG